ncbi:MAG: S-adenosylmethionine:tRNA ribosyltransferase-isomerase [Chthoniobacter sp.]|jgi:S-adenosylmethionine:tRNA ribosyltransferase-isomerase|nr:S-adenosylmethionine:tRNA ribosyltransferase-isomerase [Chthoniobacter sp.]
MSFLTQDYDYELPDELIARHPLARRESSRMMVLHRAEQRIEHRVFWEFPTFLREDDLVVLNDTKVIPARAFSDDGKIELLFLESTGTTAWKCMVKPGRKMRVGREIFVGGVRGRVAAIVERGERVIEFDGPVDLEKVGHMPIPPYFDRADEAQDKDRYQTVFAENPGAVAAPTAGLHFTSEILEKIPHAFITLHVGAGTFSGVKTEDVREHTMHAEHFVVGESAAAEIGRSKRIVAVGTTAARVLESCMQRDGEVRAQENETDIFIYPPFQFRAVGALLTNFHLPRSTLLMLVSALAGREFVLRAYAEAIAQRYRFYSYGDCMLIV